jgi:hypothetical protein
MIAALEPEATLLALKIGFLVALYLFIMLIVRSATRDLRVPPQESVIISAREVAEHRSAQVPVPVHRLQVVNSPTLATGASLEIRGHTRLGRGPENAVRLDGDEFVSSKHATIESRNDGLWVSDEGSTNGTFVNDARVSHERLLRPGDIVRIGRTDLRVEG